jgi:hypothetical protein
MMGGKAGKLANAAKKGDQMKGLKSDPRMKAAQDLKDGKMSKDAMKMGMKMGKK